MTLKPGPKYPSRRAYVLKVRSDAGPDALAGRLENLATGRRSEFATAQELVDSLAADLAASGTERPADPTRGRGETRKERKP
jgi:hypothetical protein